MSLLDFARAAPCLASSATPKYVSQTWLYALLRVGLAAVLATTDDIDSLDAAFVPGTGWPEPGGLLPREAHKLVGGVAKEGLCGMELVEVRDISSPVHATARG